SRTPIHNLLNSAPDPINQVPEPDRPHFREGLQVAAWLNHWHASAVVTEHGITRAPRWSDFLLLVRRKSYLLDYERALRAHHIPCISPRKGGLLTSLEVLDLVALLNFLMTPTADLALAHILKSPLFNVDDQSLLRLRRENEQSSWQRMCHHIHDHDCPLTLHAAHRRLIDWLACASHLPVHDLLDHIYASGAVKQRYAQAAPALLREQVGANLDAFLRLALEMDGGRYPSLPKFIEELLVLRRGDENESPDEGDMPSEENDDLEEAQETHHPDAVRILTIHAAKGLEAPFVVLLDANRPLRTTDPSGVLVSWPPDQSAPDHISAWGKGWRGARRDVLFEQEKRIAKQEDWNLLYVAMTRARQIFLLSGIAEKSDSTDPIPDSWYARLQTTDHAMLLTAAPACTTQKKINAAIVYYDFAIPQSPPQQATPTSLLAPQKNSAYIMPDTLEIPTPEMVQGILFHRLLERISRKGLLPIPSDQDLSDWLSAPIAECQVAATAARCLINAAACQRFFIPDQYIRAWNELALFSADGALLQIDRLVEFADELIILDFKSSVSPLNQQDYIAQLERYIAALKLIRQDKPIHAALITAHGTLHTLSALREQSVYQTT
ncbi:MAG: ATP-dependent exonuclease, partial [Ottowia sp.]|nr:ATP-dependent exonuclease [Ottowia sp.]